MIRKGWGLSPSDSFRLKEPKMKRDQDLVRGISLIMLAIAVWIIPTLVAQVLLIAGGYYLYDYWSKKNPTKEQNLMRKYFGPLRSRQNKN